MAVDNIPWTALRLQRCSALSRVKVSCKFFFLTPTGPLPLPPPAPALLTLSLCFIAVWWRPNPPPHHSTTLRPVCFFSLIFLVFTRGDSCYVIFLFFSEASVFGSGARAERDGAPRSEREVLGPGLNRVGVGCDFPEEESREKKRNPYGQYQIGLVSVSVRFGSVFFLPLLFWGVWGWIFWGVGFWVIGSLTHTHTLTHTDSSTQSVLAEEGD